jgi:hypothetical protein
MITLVFVHGTGVRKKGYDDTLAVIREQIAHRPDVRVADCLWGEAHGCQLHAAGASVPTYDAGRGIGDQLTSQQVDEAIWGLLLRDPLGELRLLAVRDAGHKKLPLGGLPGDKLAAQAAAFARTGPPVAPLRDALADAGLLDVFEEARRLVLASDAYKDAISTAVEPFAEERAAVARAMIAQAISLRRDQGYDPAVRLDADRRDRLVDLLINVLGGGSRGLGGRLGQHAWRLAAAVTSSAVTIAGTYYAQLHRGRLTDEATLPVGDILLYQARGEVIRRSIAEAVLAADAAAKADVKEGESSKLAVVGHSLGGIAAVDLLASDRGKPTGQRALECVDLLVTLGSQSPFLYEIGALSSLPYGKGLPEAFPRWLNIYDLADFLSYVGYHEKLFGDRIEDLQVFSRQPFPAAHGAYFRNPAVWQAVLERLKCVPSEPTRKRPSRSS